MYYNSDAMYLQIKEKVNNIDLLLNDVNWIGQILCSLHSDNTKPIGSLTFVWGNTVQFKMFYFGKSVLETTNVLNKNSLI